MAISEIHQGDIGVKFQAVVEGASGPVNLSGATLKKFMFQKPDGTTLDVVASFETDGTDGALKYVTVSGDLDQSGLWRRQARYVVGGDSKHEDVIKFNVRPNLPLEA